MLRHHLALKFFTLVLIALGALAVPRNLGAFPGVGTLCVSAEQ